MMSHHNSIDVRDYSILTVEITIFINKMLKTWDRKAHNSIVISEKMLANVFLVIELFDY